MLMLQFSVGETITPRRISKRSFLETLGEVRRKIGGKDKDARITRKFMP